MPSSSSARITVSTIKHAHHRFDVDRPGKDSYRHRGAGASEVLISSELRWALLHEHRGAAEPSLDALIAKLSPVDLVLVEGFKSHAMDKLEVHRPSLGSRFDGACMITHVVAVASDAPVVGADVPVLPLNEPGGRRRLHRPPLPAGRLMAQLTDDCFAFGGALLPLNDALAELRQRTACVVGDETVPLVGGLGQRAGQ